MNDDLDDLTLVYMYGFKNGKDSMKEEIDRLRAALEKIMQKCPYAKRGKWCACLDCNCIIARTALEGEKKDD